jgi:hypothetical protein
MNNQFVNVGVRILLQRSTNLGCDLLTKAQLTERGVRSRHYCESVIDYPLTACNTRAASDENQFRRASQQTCFVGKMVQRLQASVLLDFI